MWWEVVAGEAAYQINSRLPSSAWNQIKRERTGDYLQPAAASRRAYILPISPMPMMPTVKPSMPSGTWEVCDWAAIFADQTATESGTELARNGITF